MGWMHPEPEQNVTIERQAITLQTRDGLTLRGMRLTGPGRSKGAVVLAHGYAEHAGRYEPIVRALAASRFAVYAVDHRGHGRSDGERCIVERFDQYVDDLALVVELARREQAGKPCYLIGHSMGGLIALRYALAGQAQLDGIVLLAPVIQFAPAVTARQEQLLRRVASRLPKLPLFKDRRGLRSTDPDVDLQVEHDPFCYHGRVRAGTVVGLADAGRDAYEQAGKLALPVLILHGDDDPLVAPAGSMALYQRIGVREGADNSLITWPGMRHELLNEPDGEQVIGVIVAWLNGHYTEWRKTQPRSAPDRANGSIA
jgi:alpha-beta hydrolase superfamily lysophospholipase